MKVLLVFGTRPEAIKMAPLIKALEREKSFDVKVCVTGQHREMLDQVLELFEIVPDYDLNIMKPRQELYDVTANVLLGMKSVLEDFRPDLLFVHGDTTTTFSAAISAFYQQIEVAHVEAGLRTDDIYSPWPEEANRQLTTRIAIWHFAPTELSRKNLLKENVPEDNIAVTGNTVIDALFSALHKIKSDSNLEQAVIGKIEHLINHPEFRVQHSKFILVTGHRRENHGQGFVDICMALKKIAISNPEIHIVYPVHLNPNVQKPVKELLSNIENVHLIEPLHYEQFIYLMDRAYFVITDSGGIQEEAPSLGKPVLVMRDATERPEALEAGTVKLVGTDTRLIVEEAQDLIENQKAYERMSHASNPYGDGRACERIVKFIMEKCNEKR
jgi:UDP-N-acetylglucosamine 2-epimerase (non-hydrolysing)